MLNELTMINEENCWKSWPIIFAGDIINLDNGEFDYFVDFCNVSEEYMKKASAVWFLCVHQTEVWDLRDDEREGGSRGEVKGVKVKVWMVKSE